MIATESLTVPDHIHGYPDVAFGGWIAGLLAERTGAATARVDFRRAVPVTSPLLLSGATLTDPNGIVLTEAGPATLDLAPLPLPTWAEAKRATETALASPDRLITDCFGCGVACAPGRGLRLFPWAVPGREIMAAAWTPDMGLADENGELPPEIVWSALDCPGGLAAFVFQRMGRGAFTAALTAHRYRPVLAGAEHLVHAWPIQRDGRKYTVGVALSTADGELCALAEALWIEPRTA